MNRPVTFTDAKPIPEAAGKAIVRHARKVAKRKRPAPLPAPPLHPDFVLTADQRFEARVLRDRMNAVLARYSDKPWRVAKLRHFRAGMLRHARTNDRALFARFMAEYREGIMAELRTLDTPYGGVVPYVERVSPAVVGGYR